MKTDYATREKILKVAADICKHNPDGTVGPKDIYYALSPQKRDYRGEKNPKITLYAISRTLMAAGYACVESRPHGYSRYKNSHRQ